MHLLNFKRILKGKRLAATRSMLFFVDFLSAIGRFFLDLLQRVGAFSLFVGRLFFYGLKPPYYMDAFKKHLLEMAFFSLPVVGLTALFTGMVLALQSYTGFSRFHSEGAIATVVVLSMTRELGPTLAGLMVAGRLGASMAAEIGSMRVTEQIDALTTLSTNPLRYLVWPRLMACLISLPFLVLIADIIGVLGGYLVGVYRLGFVSQAYLQQTIDFLKPGDVLSGLLKALVFGFIVAVSGCYQGYQSKKGAAGVGYATTKAVVGASITILLANYFLTALLFES